MSARHPPKAITKGLGHGEPFSEGKLRASLLRAGADEQLTETVVRDVRKEVKPNATSEDVRRAVIRSMGRDARHVAGRYNLKRAILNLGPGGYVFERFWGAVLEQMGFAPTYDIILPGCCARHEVDVVATRRDELRLAECKFHNAANGRTDIKTALYVYARSLDLRAKKNAGQARQRFELVTNTRFTSDAINYAQCVRLDLVSWDHPAGGSLRDLVDRYALYPITCLSTLNAGSKRLLLEQRVATCRQLVAQPELMENIGLSTRHIRAVLREAEPLQRIGDVVRGAHAELQTSDAL